MFWKLAFITVPLALAGGVAQAGSFHVVPVQYDFYAEDDEYDSGYDEYYDEPEYVPPVRVRPQRPSRRPAPLDEPESDMDAADAGPRSSILCSGRFYGIPKPRPGWAKKPASSAPKC